MNLSTLFHGGSPESSGNITVTVNEPQLFLPALKELAKDDKASGTISQVIINDALLKECDTRVTYSSRYPHVISLFTNMYLSDERLSKSDCGYYDENQFNELLFRLRSQGLELQPLKEMYSHIVSVGLKKGRHHAYFLSDFPREDIAKFFKEGTLHPHFNIDQSDTYSSLDIQGLLKTHAVIYQAALKALYQAEKVSQPDLEIALDAAHLRDKLAKVQADKVVPVVAGQFSDSQFEALQRIKNKYVKKEIGGAEDI